MSIIVFTTPQTTGSEKAPYKWFDCHTTKNLQCVFTNVFLGCRNAPLGLTLLLNTPLRVINCAQALRYKEYWKIAFEISSFTTLFFPYGISMSIVLDCASEMTAIYKKVYWMTKEKALEILDLKDAQDQAALKKQYEHLAQKIDIRIAKTAELSPKIANELKDLRSKIDVAYRTLNKGAT